MKYCKSGYMLFPEVYEGSDVFYYEWSVVMADKLMMSVVMFIILLVWYWS